MLGRDQISVAVVTGYIATTAYMAYKEHIFSHYKIKFCQQSWQQYQGGVMLLYEGRRGKEEKIKHETPSLYRQIIANGQNC